MGKIYQNYLDENKTQKGYPRTVGKAVKLKNGSNVQEELDDLALKVDEQEGGMDANMENVAENIGNVGLSVDTLEYRIGQYPQTLLGHGVPSASIRPVNLGNDKNTGFPLPWLGTPEFVGQMYVNLDASNGGLYYSIPVYDTYGNISSLKWGNANS